MRAKPAYRDRDDTEVAVLDALADRATEGMTVFELRAKVDVDIDTLEDALAVLKEDDLIEVSHEAGRTVIVPDERVIGPEESENTHGIFDRLRERWPF